MWNFQLPPVTSAYAYGMVRKVQTKASDLRTVRTVIPFESILAITDDTRKGRGLLALYMIEIDDAEEGAVANETPLKACVPDRRCCSPELDVVGMPN